MNIRNMLTRDISSVANVGDFDFQGKNPEMLSDISVAIRTYLDVHGKFCIVVMNHDTKKYYVGTTGTLRNYLFNLSRFISHGRTFGISSLLLTEYVRSMSGSWSVEVVKHNGQIRNEIANRFKGWKDISTTRAVRGETISVVKALHVPTGWTRFYSIETSEESSVSPSRWSQLLAVASKTPDLATMIRKHSLSDSEYLNKRNMLTNFISKSIRKRTDFVFEVIMRKTTIDEAASISKQIRELNLLASTAWSQVKVIKKLHASLLDKPATDGVECVYPGQAIPTPPVTEVKVVEKTMPAPQPAAVVDKPVPIATTPVVQPLTPAPLATVEQLGETLVTVIDVTRHDLPPVGAVESLYTAKRSLHHNSHAMAIVLRLAIEGISIDNFAEVAVKLINGSDLLVLSLGGEVDETMIKNAVINNTAPNPECDFAFFEILGAVSEAVVSHVS